jgi:hypothetical protein
MGVSCIVCHSNINGLVLCGNILGRHRHLTQLQGYSANCTVQQSWDNSCKMMISHLTMVSVNGAWNIKNIFGEYAL